jgi:hypothetical protein
MTSTVRKIVAAELRAKQEEYKACGPTPVAKRVKLAHEVKALEREVEQLDRQGAQA